MQRPSDLIQSVSRALRILEAVGAAPAGVSAKVVARRCALRLSTTYHLLRTLSYEGYLMRLPNGDYVLGLEIADRFRDLRAALARTPQVSAVLRRVAQATAHSAYLARFVDGRITITAVVEGPRSPRLEDLIPGFDEGAHATALGKALLSTLPVAERHAYVEADGLRPFTSATVRDLDDLDRELEALDGDLFLEVSQYREEVACGAVLIATGDPGDPWWALGVSAAAPCLLARRRALAEVLRSAAADLAA